MDYRLWTPLALLLLAGCATPGYAVRPSPTPNESAAALEIERSISAIQARSFERQGERAVGPQEVVAGFAIQRLVNRLSRVTERPALAYRVHLVRDDDPNAAALADGRIYVTTGMLAYLAGRGSRPDELAFILGHELAHTVAQHLVTRYQRLQQQQLLLGLVAAGISALSQNAAGGAGRVALNIASLLTDVAESGYSQADELEADQLGIRYVIRAGFDPQAALDLLQDFARFDAPSPFLRTHPYSGQRRDYLQRYLADAGPVAFRAPAASPQPAPASDDRLKRLRQAQRLYPRGSVSWQNLQRHIEALEGS